MKVFSLNVDFMFCKRKCVDPASFSCFRRCFSFTASLQGPLHMYPPAEDNYGTDACSLLCLTCRPGILVISTCEGKLYNCVLLQKPNTANITEVSRITTSTQLLYSFFTSCAQLLQHFPAPSPLLLYNL